MSFGMSLIGANSYQGNLIKSSGMSLIDGSQAQLIIANSYYKALLGRFGMSLISLTQKQLIPEY